MSKEPRLSRLGVLAPAALSACMDASVMAVPAAGAIVSTVLKELSKAFMLKKWFHGMMSAKDAELLIMERGRNGSFLVRESQTHPGEYVLSVRASGRVSHVMIRHQHNKYDVGSGEKFDDLVGLIEHFRCYPMTESSGDVLRLLQPVSGRCIRAQYFDRRKPEIQESRESQKLHLKNGFESEFQSLWLPHEENFSTFEGFRTENTVKNRYKNILPCDRTRVILQGDGHPASTYINANYINSSHSCDSSSASSNESLNSVQSLRLSSEVRKPTPLVSKSLSDEALKEIKKYLKLDKMNGNNSSLQHLGTKKSYIATQGCLTNTINDFWRMIWQHDVRIIVMITKEIENGKVKCERYWPSLGEEVLYHCYKLKFISEITYEDFLMREFTISNDDKCRTLYQYQYMTWPDHTAPEEPDGVLSFIEHINRRMNQIAIGGDPPEQNILCVHCSAGVGRTGTFIVLDILIDKIKSTGNASEVDIPKTVRLVRAQRQGMVQNKHQYYFIYKALQKYLENKKIKIVKKMYTSDA